MLHCFLTFKVDGSRRWNFDDMCHSFGDVSTFG